MHAGARTVLVAWYGSFEAGGTIGDLLAMRSVVARLAGDGHAVSHASAHDVEVAGSRRVDLNYARPDEFDGLVFVCGPIIRGHPQTQALFERFAAKPKLGVAVSLFPAGHANYADLFDRVLPREGRAPAFEDVAIAAPPDAAVVARSDPRFTVGIVLRGPQSEYEPQRCLAERTSVIVREAARELAARRCGRVVEIENHLQRSGIAPAAIESQYAACDLVLTSRFHGAMLALRHGVPFVAVDQIEGGAKVSALIGATGWPHVYRAEAADAAAIVAAAEDALSGRLDGRMADITRDTIGRARATLDAAAGLVRSLAISPRPCAPSLRRVAASPTDPLR
ncbi:MAG TPA: polysaccharide pyruvyl transferase family protein [Candidatus Elarobacter sp.]|nr:polysaccharide pyruvyl transferase family protein [Candidatus Elarobacter sp.]